jgi:hypothetical protein
MQIMGERRGDKDTKRIKGTKKGSDFPRHVDG